MKTILRLTASSSCSARVLRRPGLREDGEGADWGRRLAAFHHRAHAHQADPMRDEGAAIPSVAIGDPRGWKSVVRSRTVLRTSITGRRSGSSRGRPPVWH